MTIPTGCITAGSIMKLPATGAAVGKIPKVTSVNGVVATVTWQDDSSGMSDLTTLGIHVAATPITSATIQAAIDAAEAAGGGIALVADPGTHDLTAGAHPHDVTKKACVNLKDDVILQLGAGVTLRLASGEQTDGGGAVDIITGEGLQRSGVIGAGPGRSKILGNTAGQTGWTGGYSQQGVNGGIINILYDATGHNDLIFSGLTLGDHFSNCLNVFGSGVTIPSRRVIARDLYCYDVGEGIQLAGFYDCWMLNVMIEDVSSVFVGDALEPAACERGGIIGFVVIGDTSGSAGSAIDNIASQDMTYQNGVVVNWANCFSPTTASGRDCDRTVFDNIVVKNPRGGTVCSEGQGQITYRNITIDCTDDPGAAVPFQTNEDSTHPPMTYENITCIATNSILLRGGRKVIMRNINSRDSIAEGLQLYRTTAEAPNVNISGCQFTGAANYGIRATGVGSEFKPTGRISDIDLRDNGSGPILIETQASLDEIDAVNLTPAVRAVISGNNLTVTGATAHKIAASVATLSGGADNQAVKLQCEQDGIILQDQAGTDGLVMGGADETFNKNSQITFRYNSTDALWYEETRKEFAAGAASTTARLFTAANSEYLLDDQDNAAFSIGAHTDWSMVFWFYEETKPSSVVLISQDGANGWNYQGGGNLAMQYRNGLGSNVYGPILSRPAVNTWTMTYFGHENGVGTEGANNTDALTTQAETNGAKDHTEGLTIGRRPLNNDQYFDGRICRVGFWSRLLTDAERTTLHNSGSGLLYSGLTSGLKSGLLAYFDMAESTGDSYCKHTSGLALGDNNSVTSAAGPS